MVRPAKYIGACVLATLIVGGVVVGWRVATHRPTADADHPMADTVVLLVHGLTFDRERGGASWGQPSPGPHGGYAWDGMIGYLLKRGFRFGGTVRLRGSKVEFHNAYGKEGSDRANLFVVEFSPDANAATLASRARELADCIRAVRDRTHCDKVRIVAHSAGGLVSRAYLQELDAPGGSHVDRLITIGTPHLGSRLCTFFAFLLGKRAECLTPESPEVQSLNSRPFPSDVAFAAIVIRAKAERAQARIAQRFEQFDKARGTIAATKALADELGLGLAVEKPAELVDAIVQIVKVDLLGQAITYDKMDGSYAERLPLDFRCGGDQVVHVTSQNLRLTGSAAAYEKATGRPIHYILVRATPPPDSSLLKGQTVHGSELSQPEVQEWVARLLLDDGKFWSGMGPAEREAWIQRQVEQSAFSNLEFSAGHSSVTLGEVRLVKEQGHRRTYRISGRYVPVASDQEVRAEGTLEIELDDFARIVACDPQIEESTPPP